MENYRLLLTCLSRYAAENKGTERGERLDEARLVVRRAMRAGSGAKAGATARGKGRARAAA